MKKTILILGALLFVWFIAPHALAQGTTSCPPDSGFCALAPIPGLTQGITADTAGLANFFNNLYKFAIGMAAALAVIQIIWGGIEIATNKDNVSKIIDSKGRILQAVLGLVLVLSPVLVFSIINPNILNLSINLEPLNTVSNTPFATGGDGGISTVDPTTQCSVTGTAGILQVAVCPSVGKAQEWIAGCASGRPSNIDTTNSDTINPTTGIREVRSINIVTCSGTQPYLFIDKPNVSSWAITRLQPLTRSSARPSNGSDAISFANACRGAGLGVGWKVCLSDTPLVTRAVSCELTGALSATTWKCYSQTLSCEYTTVETRCSESPNWTPFP